MHYFIFENTCIMLTNIRGNSIIIEEEKLLHFFRYCEKLFPFSPNSVLHKKFHNSMRGEKIIMFFSSLSNAGIESEI